MQLFLIGDNISRRRPIHTLNSSQYQTTNPTQTSNQEQTPDSSRDTQQPTTTQPHSRSHTLTPHHVSVAFCLSTCTENKCLCFEALVSIEKKVRNCRFIRLVITYIDNGPGRTLADFLIMHKFLTKILSGISSTEFKVINPASGRPDSIKTKGLPRIPHRPKKFGDLRQILKKNNT